MFFLYLVCEEKIRNIRRDIGINTYKKEIHEKTSTFPFLGTGGKKVFKKWVVDKYKDADSPRGDFARDCRDDRQFPRKDDRDVIALHLTACGACYEAQAVFKSLWMEYCREVKRH